MTHHEHQSEKKKHEHHDIDQAKDPFRHFSYNLSKKEQKGKMLLALIGCESNSNEEPKRAIALLDQNNGAVRETDEKALIGILSALRVAIMSGEKDVAHDNVNKVAMNPFQWKRSVFTDTRPITKYFYAFCMGGRDLEKEKILARNDTEVKSRILANGVILDMSLRMIDHFKPRPFQLMMGRFLSTIPKSQTIHVFMSSVRVSTHPTRESNKKSKDAISMITEGMTLDQNGFAHSIVDNVDYKKKVGIEHFTHVLLSNNSEADVNNDGASNWDRDDGEDWEDLKKEIGEEELISQVYDVNDDDWRALSKYEMNMINTIKRASLPSLELCIEMEEQEKYDRAGSIALNLGNRLPEPLNHPSRMKQSDAESANNSKSMSFYDRNRLSIQPPFHSNLGAIETVVALTESMIRTIDRWTPTEGESLQGLIYAICADGGPTKLFLRRREEMEKDGDDRFKKVEWFSGSFHLMINSLRNLNGKHSKEFFSSVCRRWRKSNQRLDWALACPDPKDIFNELYQYKVATTRNLCDKVGIEATPREINEYLVERAVAYPVCLLALIHLKFTTVILMLRDSWRSGDHGNVTQYLTCLRYLIRLEATSNAPKYLHMNTHFLKWYKCSSTCLKKIFEHYLFTKVTNNGELMPSDLCMEKHVGDVRYMYGKKMFTGMLARIIAEVPILDKLMTRYQGNEFGDKVVKKIVPYNDRTYSLGEPYVKAYNFAEKLNLWGEGPPNLVDNDNLVSMSTGKPISATILRTWTESGKRVKEYCRGNNPSLACFRSRTGQLQNDMKTETIRLTSTIYSELDALPKGTFTREAIWEEIQLIREYFDDHELDFLDIGVKKKDKKPQLLEALIKLREKYFKNTPEALEERKDLCEEDEIIETFTSEETRKLELDAGERFYKLHEDARHD